MTGRIRILLVAGLIAIGWSTWSPSSAATTLRLGLITPPTHLWTQAAQQFSEVLATESGNSMRVVVYPSRQLGTEAQMLHLLQTGALDFAILTASELSNRWPAFAVFSTPYLARDAREVAELLSGPAAAELLQPLADHLGIVGIGYTMAGMRQVLVRGGVASAQDLRGMKLRITPSATVRDFYRLLGAAPTPMPLSAVFDALANRQIDAIDMDLESILKLRFFEYADTLVLSNHMMFPAIGVVSAKTWARLDAPDRRLIERVFREQLAWVTNQYPSMESEWLDALADRGVSILEVGPEFFSATVQEWLTIWEPHTAANAQAIRLEVDQIRRQREPP